MSVKRSDEVRREISRRYEKSPEGWHVISGLTDLGDYEMVIMRGNEVWILREWPLNPNEKIGFGAHSSLDSQIVLPETFPFGVRPVEEEEVELLEEYADDEEMFTSILSHIARSRPRRFSEVTTPFLLQGPIISVRNPTSLLSAKYRELSRRLRHEINKVIKQKYHFILSDYV
ncbi:hypothetical protein DRN93_00790 [archaeon]|nr:MAG: hypothetical protein DRN93_00790 [archaeon]